DPYFLLVPDGGAGYTRRAARAGHYYSVAVVGDPVESVRASYADLVDTRVGYRAAGCHPHYFPARASAGARTAWAHRHLAQSGVAERAGEPGSDRGRSGGGGNAAGPAEAWRPHRVGEADRAARL